MTPNAIEILIHCHVCADQHPRMSAPAVRSTFESLETNGLIEQHEKGYFVTTDRGKAHIDQLCSLKWPVQRWVDDQVSLSILREILPIMNLDIKLRSNENGKRIRVGKGELL